MLRRTFVSALGATVATPALAPSSWADDWPTRQVKVVIPYPPGGPTDVSIRIVMEKVGRLLGQPILFDNKGGASGMIGAEYAKTQPADGYTFLGNTIAMMAITRHLQPIPFDPDKDFLTVARLATSWGAMAVHPSVPARTVAERRRPNCPSLNRRNSLASSAMTAHEPQKAPKTRNTARTTLM